MLQFPINVYIHLNRYKQVLDISIAQRPLAEKSGGRF